MLYLREMTIKAKLYTMSLFSTVGVGAVLCLSLWVLHEYRVNGPVYDRLIRRTAALGDIEPATFDMSEAYLTLVEMSTATDANEIERLRGELAGHESYFNERAEFWSTTLWEGPTRKTLTHDVLPGAHEFYQAVRTEFLPLVDKKERKELPRALAEKIRPRYLKQRENIKKAVAVVKNTNSEDEQSAAERTHFWLTTMIIITIASVTATGLSGWLLTREILGPTRALIERVKGMAGGASDLTARVPVESANELGQLAEGFNATIAKIHTIVQRVREASVQMLSTAAEINGAARQQESTAHALGSSTSEIAASVRQISATSKELSATMNEVSERAGRATALADTGQTRLGHMATAMQQLVAATGAVSSKLATIREKADAINGVVTTITKVADQTNLLSINAAIEAEKAGEYGRGFLVVAREIRRLADQTAVATLDIETMVRQMQDAVSAGVMQMDKFTEEVRTGVARIAEINAQTGQIIEEVHALSERFRLVNEGVRNQSLGAEQIDTAMEQVTAGAQQTRASIDEFKRATEHLRGSVALLNQEVSQFKV
jgi:methyl-accepting chemotaxis protein WspA